MLKKIKSVYNDKHFYRIIIRHWKKTFKKCNFLIIVFFSQIAQATTFEKLNLLVFRVDDIIKTFHFAVWNETFLVFRA
jgi:hypothetical protein